MAIQQQWLPNLTLTNMLGFFKKQVPPPIVGNIEHVLRDGNDFLSNDKIILTEELSADLFCEGEVVVDGSGVLTGNITAWVCTIGGAIYGDVTSTEMLQLKSTAVINGNIRTALLDIEEGAVINGRITVGPDTAAIKVDLINKLKRLTTADLLPPKIKPAVADIEVPLTVVERKTEAKPSFGTLRAAEKREIAVFDKPKIVQKELSAAAPQPRVAENAEANNRWW